ncbi:MAG: type II toxin-antitoxin system ParD family antitoxin [Archangium sp.]|nr:type II toxin-antitoxin system ParD family antitoxin [Archangium sp.]
MSKNTSVSLGKHFEAFITSQIEGGRFSTTSEVLRAGLRLLEEDEARMAALRRAIDEADAAEVVDYSIDDILRRPRKRRGAKK